MKIFLLALYRAINFLKFPLLFLFSLQIIPTICSLWKIGNLRVLENIFSGIFPMLLIMLPIMLFSKQHIYRRIGLIVIYISYSLVGLLQSVHLYLYSYPLLDSSMLAILGTNFNESIEFFQHFIDFPVILISFSCLALPIPFLKICIQIENNRQVTFTIFVILLIVMVIRTPEKFWRRDPIGSVYNTWSIYEKKLRELNNIPLLTQEAVSAFGLSFSKEHPFTLVIVIGESANRSHQQLYGYSRETTPLIMRRKKDILLFEDIISPAMSTLEAHSKILMIPTQKKKYKLPIIDMLNELNIETWWLTAQAAYEEHYSPMPLRAKHICSLTRWGSSLVSNTDEGILSKFSEMLCESEKIPHRVFFVNLIGSHFKYRSRYPKTYEFFKGKEGIRSSYATNEKAVDVINSYDNSIRYTDFILDSLISQLENSHCENSALLYLSDHGQDVYDSTDHAAHSFNGSSGVEIPFWVWMSNSFQERKKAELIEWKSYTKRKAVSDCLGFFVSELLGITLNDGNHYLSPLSKEYKPYKRITGGRDYETLMK